VGVQSILGLNRR